MQSSHLAAVACASSRRVRPPRRRRRCGGSERARERTVDSRILSMPFGPSVVLTRSETAMAPTKEARRAISPFSSTAEAFRMAWPGALLLPNMVASRQPRRGCARVRACARRCRLARGRRAARSARGRAGAALPQRLHAALPLRRARTELGSTSRGLLQCARRHARVLTPCYIQPFSDIKIVPFRCVPPAGATANRPFFAIALLPSAAGARAAAAARQQQRAPPGPLRRGTRRARGDAGREAAGVRAAAPAARAGAAQRAARRGVQPPAARVQPRRARHALGRVTARREPGARGARRGRCLGAPHCACAVFVRCSAARAACSSADARACNLQAGDDGGDAASGAPGGEQGASGEAPLPGWLSDAALLQRLTAAKDTPEVLAALGDAAAAAGRSPRDGAPLLAPAECETVLDALVALRRNALAIEVYEARALSHAQRDARARSRSAPAALRRAHATQRDAHLLRARPDRSTRAARRRCALRALM
jgi:hypothetical protein